MTDQYIQLVEPRLARRPPSLVISVRAGTGTGSTALSAFDDALYNIGIANRNLIPLSSVIPPGSTLRSDAPGQPVAGGWGDRLYVVRAEQRVEMHNEEAWAGIGWVQEDETDSGLMVEHEGHSQTQVEADIEASLDELVARRRDFVEARRGTSVVGITCESNPVCALVVATFGSEPWHDSSIDLR